MVTGMLLGVAAGAGLWLLVAGLRPRRPTLTEAVAALHHPPSPGGPGTGDGWRERWERLALTVTGVTTPPATQTQDLAVLGRTRARHAVDKLTYVAVFAGLPVLTATVVGVAGVAVPPVLVLAVAAAGAAGGLFVPDRTVAREAANRRLEFRTALSTYVDLVVASMAAGTAAEGALNSAATIGSGWAFEQLRAALAMSARDNSSPWDALGRLADDLALTDLAELTSSLTLVGESGARVRASLTAKAQALRDHELTDAQADAEAASERMSLPVVALMVGFLLLVGYPALARVLAA